MIETSTKGRHTPDIVAEHLEELPSDCARRMALLIDQRAFPTHLRALDGIIDARIEGIALAGSSAVSALAASAASMDTAESCAATLCLLNLGTLSAWIPIIGALDSGTAGWPGIAKALAWSTAVPPIGALRALAESADAALAVVGLVGSAARSDAQDLAPRIAALCGHGDATVRLYAYLAAALADLRLGRQDEILHETDPAVRWMAIEAAAWSAEPWLLAIGGEHPDLITCAAVVYPDLPVDERDAFIERCLDPTIGVRRFDILASFGHPSVVPRLLEGMSSPDPTTALAAGAAFSRMFAADIDSSRMASTSSEPMDDFDRAFADKIPLPDPELADRLWHDLEPSLASASRIASGVDVGRRFDPDALDLRSRREWAMRRAYHSGAGSAGGMGEIERFGRV